MEAVTNVLKANELNKSVKERTYQERFRENYEVFRGEDVESGEKD